MGYDQYTCFWHCSYRIYFCCFSLALANIRPWPLLSFFEINFVWKTVTENHPQYLSGLSRALFPTTFLELAVLIVSAKVRFIKIQNWWTVFQNICFIIRHKHHKSFSFPELQSFWSASPRIGIKMKSIVHMSVYRRAINKVQKSELRQKQFNQLLLAHSVKPRKFCLLKKY